MAHFKSLCRTVSRKCFCYMLVSVASSDGPECLLVVRHTCFDILLLSPDGDGTRRTEQVSVEVTFIEAAPVEE